MKSHTGFGFVPIPMTLNDLERCNSPYFAFFTHSIALLADYVTVVEDRPIISVKYCLPVPVFHFRPKLMYLQRGLSAIAEHLELLFELTDFISSLKL